MNMGAITKVTVTAASNSLADLAVTVDPQLRRIALLPVGEVRWALRGAASGTSPVIPAGGIDFPMDAANAALLRFYATDVLLTVLQFV
jgi:methyl coenzyme M reductase subunit C